jgi:uncharacterized OB-fold protein
MAVVCTAPDCSTLEVPADQWTQPFWDAAAAHTLRVPRCSDCGRFRWPPGPFCPGCQSQWVEWVAPGRARIYSFTLVPEPATEAGQAPRVLAPALVEFDDAPGVRLIASIVDAPIDRIAIGAALEVGWIAAADATVPVFRLA